MSLRRSVVQRCGVPSVEISSLRVGNRCRCGGSAVVSRSQQGAAVSLLLARRSTGKSTRWCRIGGFVVAKSQVGHGTGSASPSGRVSVISDVREAELRRGRCSGENWNAWTHLLALFISKHSTCFRRIGLPPYEKMRSN